MAYILVISFLITSINMFLHTDTSSPLLRFIFFGILIWDLTFLGEFKMCKLSRCIYNF